MTHPDRRRYGGLDLAPPGVEDMGPAEFDANYEADFSADTSVNLESDASADYRVNAFDREGKVEADPAMDFPAEPTGPAARGFHRNGR
ncbi:MAG: hypothetical protein ACOY94_12290 [Bacillota bacterium]